MPSNPFGVHVRTRLKMLGRTQKQLAEALGYSQSYLSMYLSDKLPYPPSLRPSIRIILRRWEAAAEEEPCTSRSPL